MDLILCFVVKEFGEGRLEEKGSLVSHKSTCKLIKNSETLCI